MQEKLEKRKDNNRPLKVSTRRKGAHEAQKKLGRFLKDIFVATLDLPRQIKHQNDS